MSGVEKNLASTETVRDFLHEEKVTPSDCPLKEAILTSSFHDPESTSGTPSSPSGKLSLEQIHQSLSTLNHNSEGLLVYTKISLSALGLCNIDLLGSYEFLQHITLDNNSLTTLQCLSGLRNLVFVSAKYNQLRESVFSDLEGSARTLETLYLEGNLLESLEGLQKFKYLFNLCVSHNHITSLRYAHFSELSSLLRLDTSWNRISTVEISVFAGSRLLRYIDLSHNSINHLHFVAYVTANLETLIFSHNKLDQLHFTLVQCHTMVTLDLSYNYLENAEDFTGLSSQELLRHLAVKGNPFFHSARSCSDKRSSAYADTRDSNDFFATRGDIKGHGNNIETSEQLLSRSEVTYEDNAGPTNDNVQESPNPFTANSHTIGRSGCEASRKAMPSHNFADITVSYAYGLVRHALVSCRFTPILYEIDPTSELVTFPFDRQVNLYLISILSQLTTLDHEVITDDDISRAMIYFRSATYADPCKERTYDGNS